MTGKIKVLIGTRKGAWTLESDSDRQRWQLEGPLHLGSVVFHYVADPRNPGLLLLSEGGGHLGPSVFRSIDNGKTWTESEKPPHFSRLERPNIKSPKVENPSEDGETGRAVDHVFWLTPGHVSQADVWYAGTSPQGLFKSVDAGITWEEVKGLNHHPDFFDWRGNDKDGTPDGPKLHSIIIDHNDPQHLIIGMSGGGIFESFDQGENWRPHNKGVDIDFFPPKEDGSEYEYGHDPHCVVMHPLDSHRLYQQNHCGIYRLDADNPDPEKQDRWIRIGNNMPTDVGDIGFPIVVHPRDIDTAWVFPMDGSGLWPRTSPDGKPAVYKTGDAGETWLRQDKGFPKQQAWWTVKRQCMAVDNEESLGLYLGTTNGQVWASFDEGETWQGIAMDLPQIYSIEVVPA